MSALIEARYNGPAASANGGYACGTFAALTAAPAAVTLHLPPPLGVPLTAEPAGRRTHVWNGDDLVATVAAAAGDVPIVPPVPAEVAEACQSDFGGRAFHPFPSCFVCGLDRADGLNLRPGPVPGRHGTVACTWQPDASLAGPGGTVRPEAVWAALDCPGGWTTDPARQARVLGRMTARIAVTPILGERCVIVGRSDPGQGRTLTSHTALYRDDGTLLAGASAIWVAITAGDVPSPRASAQRPSR
ncbi:hypothetical protein [Streptomyces sp. NPDC046862]|uniref:hypothetical protein n=1 Tax=Streptomyces sp. NPDC046862 TaxID=3154603 RepID=UPI0034520BC7